MPENTWEKWNRLHTQQSLSGRMQPKVEMKSGLAWLDYKFRTLELELY